MSCGPGSAWRPRSPTVALLFPATFTRLLHPLRLLHAEWVDVRLARLTSALRAFARRRRRSADVSPARSSSRQSWCAFYLAIAHSMRIPIGFAELAVIVPVTFIVPDDPAFDERVRCEGSDVRFLFHPPRAAAGIGAAGPRLSAPLSSCSSRLSGGSPIWAGARGRRTACQDEVLNRAIDSRRG